MHTSTRPGRDHVEAGWAGVQSTEHAPTGFRCRLARDGIRGSCSWAFDVMSFVSSWLRSKPSSLRRARCGTNGMPIILPRARPETGITLPAGPGQDCCGQSSPDDAGCLRVCDMRPQPNSWTRMPIPSRQAAVTTPHLDSPRSHPLGDATPLSTSLKHSPKYRVAGTALTPAPYLRLCSPLPGARIY